MSDSPFLACTQQTIEIKALCVLVHIGITPEEQATPQKVEVDLSLHIERPFSEMDDNIENTVDYFKLSNEITQYCEAGEWCLIETLCSDLGLLVLRDPLVSNAFVQVRKFILEQTDYVAVSSHFTK